ncbi:uncharacterized [Tachysurus ichikawai]
MCGRRDGVWAVERKEDLPLTCALAHLLHEACSAFMKLKSKESSRRANTHPQLNIIALIDIALIDITLIDITLIDITQIDITLIDIALIDITLIDITLIDSWSPEHEVGNFAPLGRESIS